jgi:hypothetical protein
MDKEQPLRELWMPIIQEMTECNIEGGVCPQCNAYSDILESAVMAWHEARVQAIKQEFKEKCEKAQARKIYEWLHEICIEHNHLQIVGSEEIYKDAACPQFERHDCPECMAEFKKEVGL